MVSFQCHGCGDVVKKPKLDQHRTRCHSGYDCIDCSKTFNTPADYRGHTSCISEAEKYEKSLYKGPKTGAPPIKDMHNTLNSNGKPHHLAPTKHKHTASTHKALEAEGPATPAIERHSNAQWGAKSVGSSGAVAPAPSNSYGGGRGGQAGGGYGRYGGWGLTRNKVTGANDTPLGTPPPRASPVNVAAPRTAAAAQANGYAETQTQKDKRRKSGAADDEAVNGDAKSNKKAKIWKEKDATVDPASIPLPSSPVPPADDGKKKSKDKDAEKEKKKLKKDKAKKLEEQTVEVEMGLSGEEEKKKSKKDKKEKQKEVLVADEDGEKTKADKKKKKKDAFEKSTPQTNGIEVNGKDRKRKRSDDDDVADAGADASLVGEKKKKKKEKKEKPSEDAMDVDAKPMVESTKKEKKNKKEKKDKVAKSIPVAVAVS